MMSFFTVLLYLCDIVHMLNKFDADMNLADSEMMISVVRTIELWCSCNWQIISNKIFSQSILVDNDRGACQRGSAELCQ